MPSNSIKLGSGTVLGGPATGAALMAPNPWSGNPIRMRVAVSVAQSVEKSYRANWLGETQAVEY